MASDVEPPSFSLRLLRKLGGRLRATTAILLWQIAVWRSWFDPQHESDNESGGKGRLWDPNAILDCSYQDVLEVLSRDELAELSEDLLAELRRRRLVWETKRRQIVLSLKALDPMRLVRTLLADSLTEDELRYYVFASIRRRYRCVLSADTARTFHAFAGAINTKLIGAAQAAEKEGATHRIEWHFRTEFFKFLTDVAEKLFAGEEERGAAAVQLFIGVARAVSYIQVDQRPGYIVCRTHKIDAEYMISSLFGLPTRIRGFDELFGGGLLLLEHVAPFNQSRINGRIVLTTGRYGTGKSLLGLQIAVEVARKGGIAWILALEQSAEECFYTLQSMRILPEEGSIAIAQNTSAAYEVLQQNQSDSKQPDSAGLGNESRRGALIIVKAEKGSYERFLATLPEPAEWMQAYSLRLIVVDPINAINKGKDPDTGKLRIETLQIFEQIKNSGTNVWFNAEDPEHDDRFFEQNIADTVIHLTTEESHGRGQRYIEIRKSRLQREQRGQHPFVIETGSGIGIFPSSGAVSDRIRSRSATIPTKPTEFGVPTFDSVLGQDALRRGDIIVLHGPAGCFKTQLGMQFLAHPEPDAQASRATVKKDKQKEHGDKAKKGRRENLIFATGDSVIGLRQLIRERGKPSGETPASDVCFLPDGQVHPGEVLQNIEKEMTGRRHEEKSVERVLFTNTVHWEMSCPFLREDEIFGSTLLELLRRQNVTSVLICSSASDGRSHLQEVVIENADCVVEFHNTDLLGRSQVILRVVKSRKMRHRRGWFELVVGPEPDSVRVLSTPSLLRVGSDGTVSRIPVRLLLHSETDMQAAYNRRVQHSLMAAVSRTVEVEEQRQVFLDRTLGLSQYSVLDELQVLQLDEHEIPVKASDASASQLTNFSPGNVEHWEDLLPRLRTRVLLGSNRVAAIPYFQNISVLAYLESIDPAIPESWDSLAGACEKFESGNSGELFFDFVKDADENYNCLYLEILLSFGMSKHPDDYALLHWLRTPDAVEALVLFWRLCHRAHSFRRANPENDSRRMQVDHHARVWRHWYSTLNQMLSDMDPAARARIRVGPLPREVCSAGEWFLAVPAHSAAPELAIALIRDLTKMQAELERVREGVGLPTRRSYYDLEGADEQLSTAISPYFSMQIGLIKRLVTGAFTRSSFSCYSQFSSILAAHLLRFLELGSIHEWHARDVCRGLELRLEKLVTSAKQVPRVGNLRAEYSVSKF